MAKREYKKVVIDGDLFKVFSISRAFGLYPSELKFLESKKHLKGIEILSATSDEFLSDYARRNGDPVAVTQGQ